MITRALSRRLVLGGALAALPKLAAARESLAFNGLYKSFGVRGMEFSDRVRSLTGSQVDITGYMAPPLKAESTFFVLSSEPLSICPFCESDANWPVDIVVVYLRTIAPLTAAGARITVTGRLDTGSWSDPETGFVSLMRLVEARYQRV
jgi:hypothetical protein